MIRPDIWRRELAVPLQSIQAELNRLFGEYWQPPGSSQPASRSAVRPQPDPTSQRAAAAESTPDLGSASESDPGPSTWTPTIDLWEAQDEFTLVVDLPGVDPATINLSLTGQVLAIRGTRPASPAGLHSESARGRVRERPTGLFHRQVTLVDDVDFDQVEAQARDGVLTVRLPKRNSTQARTIPVLPA